MQSFQNTFKLRKRLFISAFSICMTVPLRKGTKFTEIFAFLVIKLQTPLVLKAKNRTTQEQKMMPIRN